MIAGLERDIGCCTPCALTRLAQGKDFGVRLTRALMPALTDDLVPARNHAADARIGLGRAHSTLSQLKGTRHGALLKICRGRLIHGRLIHG